MPFTGMSFSEGYTCALQISQELLGKIHEGNITLMISYHFLEIHNSQNWFRRVYLPVNSRKPKPKSG
jgi:hypothetical protein